MTSRLRFANDGVLPFTYMLKIGAPRVGPVLLMVQATRIWVVAAIPCVISTSPLCMRRPPCLPSARQ